MERGGWAGGEVQTDVGVLRKETRQLDVDSEEIQGNALSLMRVERTCSRSGRKRNARAALYALYEGVCDTADNWIIKANRTKARAPPPG